MAGILENLSMNASDKSFGCITDCSSVSIKLCDKLLNNLDMALFLIALSFIFISYRSRINNKFLNESLLPELIMLMCIIFMIFIRFSQIKMI